MAAPFHFEEGEGLPQPNSKLMPLHDPQSNEGFLLPSEPQPTYTAEGTAIARGIPIHWTAEFPEEPVFDGVWHFMNGFLATEETSAPFRHAAASAGFPTITVEPVRKDGGNLFVRARNPQKAHADAHLAVVHDTRTSRKIRTGLPNGHRLALDRRIFIPHSMSGLVAPRVALAIPSMTEGIINFQAVGYGQPQAKNIGLRLITGFPGSVRHEVLPAGRNGHLKPSWQMAYNEAKYVAADLSRTLCEGNSCLRENVTRKIGHLMMDHDIWVAYLAAKYDFLVPADQKIAKFVSLYRVVANAGHMLPQAKPELAVREAASAQSELQAA